MAQGSADGVKISVSELEWKVVFILIFGGI